MFVSIMISSNANIILYDTSSHIFSANIVLFGIAIYNALGILKVGIAIYNALVNISNILPF